MPWTLYTLWQRKEKVKQKEKRDKKAKKLLTQRPFCGKLLRPHVMGFLSMPFWLRPHTARHIRKVGTFRVCNS